MYYLAKIDLNYLWMQFSTLGHRTGWDEYWEAKRPDRGRAHEATHPPPGTGGPGVDGLHRGHAGALGHTVGDGRREPGPRAQDPAQCRSRAGDFYAKVEADFALWEMLAREGKRDEALPIAQGLLVKFPENEDLSKFVSGG